MATETKSTVIVPYWKYAIIPAVVILVMVFVPSLAPTVIKHVPKADYIVSSLILLGGIIELIVQVAKGGDTDKSPYWVQVAALFVFLTWAWTSQPAV